MILPPLQLEQYFFDKIQLESRRDHQPGTHVGLQINSTLEIAQTQSGPWLITLTLKTQVDQSTPPPPYEFELRTVGFFRLIQPQPTAQETARLMGITGASILYSAARELLLILTGRGPWGQLTIPLVSFMDLQVEINEPTASRPPTDGSQAVTP